METNHEKFLKHLEESREAVSFVADWLRGFGLEVKPGESSVAKEAKDWKDHVDSGDLFVKQRVEVKKLSRCFTTRHWPFGCKFMVCAKHSYDNAVPKPHMYVIVSDDYGCIAIAKSSEQSSWFVEKRKDSRYQGIVQDYYFAPLECVKFISLRGED